MPTNLNSIIIIILFIIPGFICERAFSSLVSRERRGTTYIILESISLSCLYYGLFSWAVILTLPLYDLHKARFVFILFGLLFVGPIITGIVWAKIILSDKFRQLQKWLGITIISPIPKAWDSYFSKGIPCWVLITLNDGTKIGGLWGPDSFVSSFPSPEDIYLETLVEVDENGNFVEVKEDTKGALIERDKIKFIEFFKYHPKGGEKGE
ncbi:MAG: DUF6338 family protein [bacterium]|nr:DUF6338 family protein [bacterium]